MSWSSLFIKNAAPLPIRSCAFGLAAAFAFVVARVQRAIGRVSPTAAARPGGPPSPASHYIECRHARNSSHFLDDYGGDWECRKGAGGATSLLRRSPKGG